MKTMLAAYLPGKFDRRSAGSCGADAEGLTVLIKMKSSGICGSDVHYIYHQHRATAAAPDKPLYRGFINGHEPCGQIVAMGQGCRHFKEGDRVLVYHISGCGFARTAVAVFLFLVLAKEKRLTAGSVTAAMLNTCWRKKKI